MFLTILREEIHLHYINWRDGVRDALGHTLFLCMSGPGTGKSRLLNEFPRLVKESVSGIDDLEQFVKNSYCFNISFENETLENPEPFDPSNVIGTRMMYQLQSKESWSEFRQKFSISIPKAISNLALLTKAGTFKNVCNFVHRWNAKITASN
jgi:hypothetical protein